MMCPLYINDIVSIYHIYIYIYTIIYFYTYHICESMYVYRVVSLGTSPARILDASSSLRQDTGHDEL